MGIQVKRSGKYKGTNEQTPAGISHAGVPARSAKVSTDQPSKKAKEVNPTFYRTGKVGEISNPVV